MEIPAGQASFSGAARLCDVSGTESLRKTGLLVSGPCARRSLMEANNVRRKMTLVIFHLCGHHAFSTIASENCEEYRYNRAQPNAIHGKQWYRKLPALP